MVFARIFFFKIYLGILKREEVHVPNRRALLHSSWHVNAVTCILIPKYICLFLDVDEIREKTCALDTEANQMKDLFDSDEMKYLCPNCNKQYKTSGGIKRPLKKVHEFSFDSEDQLPTSGKNHVAIYRASLMKCALLLRDTNDAFKIENGNRVTTNAKFQMLLSRVGKHNKYQLWLFRYLTYIKCILSPKIRVHLELQCKFARLYGNKYSK